MKKFLLSVAAIIILLAGNVQARCFDGCDCGLPNCNCGGCPNVYYEEESAPSTDGDYESFATEVLSLVNAERAKVGAPPLKLANDLQQASAIRAREIVQLFSHTRPDGSDCFTVMSNRGRTCGENVAGGQSSPEAVMNSWMDSEGHRENILNPAFRELGVGYVYEDYSTYHHYWVQLFRG